MKSVVSATSCILMRNASALKKISPLTEILLIPREKPPLEGVLAIPGGRINYHEKWEDACAREVKEETGYLISPNKISLLRVSNAIYPDKHFLIVTGWGWLEGKDEEGTPELESQWRTFEEVENMSTDLIVPNVKQTVAMMR